MPFPTAGPFLYVDSPTHFRLSRGILYCGKHDTWYIPEGFRTDLASIPRAFRWLITSHGAHTNAAILHDYLCWLDRKGVGPGRRHSDGLFRRVLREEGVPLHLRWLMWAAVRLGCYLQGGMTAKEAAQLAACLPGGLLVLLLSIGPLLGRGILRTIDAFGSPRH